MNKFSFRKPANKFWRTHNQPGNGCHLGNPLMEITTRDRGEIPGCTPAPEEHIYRPVSLGQAQAENSARADKYCAALVGWVEGNDFGTTDMGQRWQAMWREGGGHLPVHGAYGEKL